MSLGLTLAASASRKSAITTQPKVFPPQMVTRLLSTRIICITGRSGGKRAETRRSGQSASWGEAQPARACIGCWHRCDVALAGAVLRGLRPDSETTSNRR